MRYSISLFWLIAMTGCLALGCRGQTTLVEDTQVPGDDEDRAIRPDDSTDPLKHKWKKVKFEPHWMQAVPGDTPELFAEGIISVKGKNSHALNFSPDGKTMVFSRYPDRKSYVMTYGDGGWSDPEDAYFLGKEVCFSRDGRTVFSYHEGELYSCAYPNAPGVEQRKLIFERGRPEFGYYPYITNSGNFYFSSNSNWDEGRIMRSRCVDGVYTEPVDLGLPINQGGASHAYIAPDESYMLFNSPREGSHTALDIWISFRAADGSWGEPINVGETINSGAHAILCPTVTPDGKYLFFTRLDNGDGNLYWVSTAFIERLK